MISPAYFLFFFLTVQFVLSNFYTAPIHSVPDAVSHVPVADQFLSLRICGTAWNAGSPVRTLDVNLRRQDENLFLVGKTGDGAVTEIKLEHVVKTGVYFFDNHNSAQLTTRTGDVYKTKTAGDGAVRISEVSGSRIAGTFYMEVRDSQGNLLTCLDGVFQCTDSPSSVEKKTTTLGENYF